MSEASGRIAITGANGFVGRAVSRALLGRGIAATGLVRGGAQCEPGVDARRIDDLGAITPDAFEGCGSVIHLAARVHMMGDAAAQKTSTSQAQALLQAYRAINVDGTLAAADAARRAGVTRFVLMSSIKVLGERDPGRPFIEDDARDPPDAYGVSKAEAEVRLLEFGSHLGLEIAIVRPPLVYGPGVRANFLAMMNAIARGMPLPLGAIDARRSLVSVDNLASATIACALDPIAAGRVFHVTDGYDPKRGRARPQARRASRQAGAPRAGAVERIVRPRARRRQNGADRSSDGQPARRFAPHPRDARLAGAAIARRRTRRDGCVVS